MIDAKFAKLNAIMQVAIDAHNPPMIKSDYIKYTNISGIEMLCKHDEYTNTTIIGFGGTDEVQDWYTNLIVHPYEDPLGFSVHTGFYDAFCLLAHKLYQYTFIRKSERLYVTGFSQGAALAQVALLYLSVFDIPTESYLAASPLVGDENFQDKISYVSKLKSYYFCNDIVHYLPFGFGYQHPENSINLGWNFSLNPHDLHKYKKAIIDYELKLSNSKR